MLYDSIYCTPIEQSDWRNVQQLLLHAVGPIIIVTITSQVVVINCLYI